MQVLENLEQVKTAKGPVYCCRSCKTTLGPAHADYKTYALVMTKISTMASRPYAGLREAPSCCGTSCAPAAECCSRSTWCSPAMSRLKRATERHCLTAWRADCLGGNAAFACQMGSQPMENVKARLGGWTFGSRPF